MTGIIIKSNHLSLISKEVKFIALHSSSISTLMMTKMLFLLLGKILQKLNYKANRYYTKYMSNCS